MNSGSVSVSVSMMSASVSVIGCEVNLLSVRESVVWRSLMWCVELLVWVPVGGVSTVLVLGGNY